jgi:Domain of unknown function (DUF4276)
MVRLGFIVEGATEKIILEKSDFFSHLRSLKIDYVDEVEDAGGNGNLLPHNIEKHIKTLKSKEATDIFILTDLDIDKCITETKIRISPTTKHTVVISVKQFESWFLSDTEAIRKVINKDSYTCANPEVIKEPFKEIRSIRRIPIRSKPVLAELMVQKGFSILKAEKHPNCNSAKYFIKKIKELSTL